MGKGQCQIDGDGGFADAALAGRDGDNGFHARYFEPACLLFALRVPLPAV